MSGAPSAVPRPGDAQPPACETEIRFRQMAEMLSDVFWIVDLLPSLSTPYVSPAFETVWGHPATALYADPWLWARSIVAEDRARVDEAWARWLAAPESSAYAQEYCIERPDGSRRWIADRGRAVRDASGAVYRVTGIAQDITERRLAEIAARRNLHERKQTAAALARQHDRWLKIARTCPSVVHSFRLSPQGHWSFLFGAERVAELYGLPATALIDDASIIAEYLHPDDLAAIDEELARSAADSTALRLEFRYQHPQRGERWIEAHSMPTFESDGSRAWHGALTDITDRKQAERALHASRAQLKAVFEDLTEGLITFRPASLKATFNRAALDLHRLAGPEDIPPTIEAYQQLFELRLADGSALAPEEWPLAKVLRGERVARYELYLHHRIDGWQTVLSFGGSLVLDAEGRPLVAVLLMSDITERHEHQAELQRLNSELEDRVAERTSALAQAVEEMESFSYSVSHDLRAPLRALDGFSQAVMEDYAALLPEPGRQYLQIVRDSAKKMGLLIDDLLAFSRLSRAKLSKRPIDPAMLVRDALSQLAALQQGRNIEWHIGELPPCHGDLALLRQVWINLISNALKYSRQRDPAVIEIGFERDEQGRVEYVVRDNGTGFDMRYVHKLFGVFERLHRAEDFEGTGVGLAIVKRVVQRHGGDVSAHGEPGVGASFRFHLGEE